MRKQIFIIIVIVFSCNNNKTNTDYIKVKTGNVKLEKALIIGKTDDLRDFEYFNITNNSSFSFKLKNYINEFKVIGDSLVLEIDSIAEPQLILMDEPLSALDARRRNNVLPYLDRLHSETSVPIIYVSHNIDEICRLSDHLILLDNGKVVAEGGLQETLARIDLPQFRGQNAGAVLEANQSRYDAEFDLSLFQFLGGELWVPGCQNTRTTRLRIDAGDISLSRTSVKSSTILNILPAVIDEMIAETASTQLVRLRLGTNFLVARITRRSLHELNLQVDDNVFAQIKSVTVRY